MERVYIDSNATTKVHPEVVKAMLPLYEDGYGNASSVHAFGRRARKYVDKARESVAALINADFPPEEIVFTSGGTESDNYAIMGIAVSLRDKGDHIIVSSVEHPAVLNTCKHLEEQGFRVTYLGVDEYGIIFLDELKNAITDDTILISIMAANNETGTVMPVEEIGSIAAEKGVIFHIDAVQFVGKMPFDVKRSGAQLVSITAHKINGPKGSGALYIKKGIELAKYMYGGRQELDRRSGTESVQSIVGFGKACELALKQGEKDYARVKVLRDGLYDRVMAEISDVSLNGHPVKRVPNTLNISFNGLAGDSIVRNLDLEGIAASTGSACTSGSIETSHVLKSMGIDILRAGGSVRLSLGIFTTQEEIDYVAEKLILIVDRLKKTVPVKKD